jgi:hypothetical protein
MTHRQHYMRGYYRQHRERWQQVYNRLSEDRRKTSLAERIAYHWERLYQRLDAAEQWERLQLERRANRHSRRAAALTHEMLRGLRGQERTIAREWIIAHADELWTKTDRVLWESRPLE